MKKIIHPFILAITLCNHNAFSMELEKKTHLVMIPEQKTLINQEFKTILPFFKNNQQLVHVIETPEEYWYDFGQTRCQNCVKEKINWLKKNKVLHDNDPLIIHGFYKNTGTAINYAANNPHNVTCLILESVMLSGNSSIKQTFENIVGIPSTSANYYVLPYASRLAAPFYSPTGEQPVKSIYALPKDLLIIILHHPDDPYLPFEDAQALYAFLTKTQKNKNVYFLTQEGKYKSDDLLTKDGTEKIAAINTILKKHNIIPASNPHERLDMDLTPYQPEVQQKWFNHFYTIYNKETNFTYVDSAIKQCAFVVALWALCSYLGM